MLIIETLLVIVGVVVAWISPARCSELFARVEVLLTRLARRKRFTVGLCAIVARLLLVPMLPIPTPGLPDEFGYLLLGNTISQFSLTNPPTPCGDPSRIILQFGSLRTLRNISPGRGIALAIGGEPPGIALCRATVLVCFALVAVGLAASWLHIPLSGARTWRSTKVQHTLTKAGRCYLILVKYPEPDSGPVTCWVQTMRMSTDIVWPFDMGQQNGALIHYFKDHKVWLPQAGALPPTRLQGAWMH